MLSGLRMDPPNKDYARAYERARRKAMRELVRLHREEYLYLLWRIRRSYGPALYDQERERGFPNEGESFF